MRRSVLGLPSPNRTSAARWGGTMGRGTLGSWRRVRVASALVGSEVPPGVGGPLAPHERRAGTIAGKATRRLIDRPWRVRVA